MAEIPQGRGEKEEWEEKKKKRVVGWVASANANDSPYHIGNVACRCLRDRAKVLTVNQHGSSSAARPTSRVVRNLGVVECSRSPQALKVTAS